MRLTVFFKERQSLDGGGDELGEKKKIEYTHEFLFLMNRRKEFYSAAHRSVSAENRGGEGGETVHHSQEQTEEMCSNLFHGCYRPVAFMVLVPSSPSCLCLHTVSWN